MSNSLVWASIRQPGFRVVPRAGSHPDTSAALLYVTGTG